MSSTEKINVLDLLINLLREHESKLDSLIERLEIVDQTITKDPQLSKTLKEYDSSTIEESSSHNILVVDDDKKLANTFKLILETSGYNIDTAFTGLQALYKISRKTYDLVLLDLNLPDIMGNEVAAEIEKRCPETDIVFITGYSTLKGKVEDHLDEKEVLMKPIEPETLLEVAINKLSALLPENRPVLPAAQ